MLKPTKNDYERWLNQMGVPQHLRKSSGGLVPDHVAYGSYKRRHYPMQFDLDFVDWVSVLKQVKNNA